MYKICFDENDNIIGFDLSICDYYINLFDINNVTKEIIEYESIQKVDSYGRKLYYMVNDSKKSEVINTNILNCEYEPIMLQIPITREIRLTYEPNLFNMNDILIEKKKQIINNYKCLDSVLYELINEQEILNFNAISGKNIIRISGNSEVISNKITFNSNKKIKIYYESDQDINIQISNNGENFINMKKNSFVPYTDNSIYIKLNCTKETNIYCMAILIS